MSALNEDRRAVLKHAGASGTLAAAFAVGLLRPGDLFAASGDKEAFLSKTTADALKNLGAAQSVESGALVIEAPQIAENGATVPIEVTSNLPNTTSIVVLVEKNPFPLAAKLEFKEGAAPYVKVNLKIGETSNVRVIAEAGGKRYSATREIKVTLGGCGG